MMRSLEKEKVINAFYALACHWFYQRNKRVQNYSEVLRRKNPWKESFFEEGKSTTSIHPFESIIFDDTSALSKSTHYNKCARGGGVWK